MEGGGNGNAGSGMHMVVQGLMEVVAKLENGSNERLQQVLGVLGGRETNGMGSRQKVEIPEFNGSMKENVVDWIFICEQCFRIAGTTNDYVKVATAGSRCRGVALSWYRGLAMRLPDMDWETLKTWLVRRFEPINKSQKLRCQLDALVQGKSIEEYVDKFSEISNRLTDMSEEDRLHFFVRGLNQKTRSEVGYKNPENVEQAINFACEYERHFARAESVPRGDPMEVNRIGGAPFRKNTQQPKSQAKRRIHCFVCGKAGHMARECADRKQVSLAEEDDDKLINTRLIIYSGAINGKTCEFMMDTGAEISVISKAAAQRLGLKIIPSRTAIAMMDGSSSTVAGETETVSVDVSGRVVQLKFIVGKLRGHEALLGVNWFAKARAMIDPANRCLFFKAERRSAGHKNRGAEKPVMAAKQYQDSKELEVRDKNTVLDIEQSLELSEREQLLKLMERYADIFASNLRNKCANVKPIAITVNDPRPIWRHPYKHSLAERKTIQKEVEEMLQAGVIRESRSPWGSAIIGVPKKDGTIRMCVDYRQLNERTTSDLFPMPLITDVLDRLQGKTIFSTLDLKSGYWQIPITEESMQITAFTTLDGHYEFTRLPFGIKNAPAEFSRIMQQVLGGLPFVEIYLDDITIHSRNFSEHLEHLEAVFTRLFEANLFLNKKKCHFAKREIEVLGHLVCEGRVKMDKSKIAAVENMPSPTNVKELQQFLGLSGYYRKFIKGYANITSPLTALLRKETVWEWTPEREESIKMLKGALTSYPVLRMPDLAKKFYLYTDASGTAIGCVLGQKDEDGSEYACYYSSRLLHGAELNYGITEKECLAVVWAVKQFRHYLHGTKFTVITDHSALVWLMNIKDPNGRLARWSIYLQAFDMEIVHKKGSEHTNADCLSRPQAVVTAVKCTLSRDIWSDDVLLHYVKFGATKDTWSAKNCTRVQKVGKDYEWKDGTLYHWIHGRRVIVPEPDKRFELLEYAHSLGHFQAKSTCERLAEKYYWHTMRQDASQYVEQCTTCLRNDKKPAMENSAQSLPVGALFDRIGIDLVFGLPTTEDGYKGILVITEYLSKYPYAVPIRTKSAKEVAGCLWKYISLFGPPCEMLSDQGTEFLNETVEQLCKGFGIDRRVTSAYNPRTNGLTERFNATLIQSLRKQAEEEPLKWDKWLPLVLLAYRSRVHSSTGFTPFELMFGRNMQWFNEPTKVFGAGEDQLIDRARELKRLVEDTRTLAQEKIKADQEATVARRDTKNSAKIESLPIGSYVYKEVPGMLGKLQARYVGPYRVVGRTKLGNYLLMSKKGTELKEATPISKLKKCTISSEDSYEVEKILQHRKVGNGFQYFVKWAGYSNAECSWIKEEDFVSPDFVRNYWRQRLSDVDVEAVEAGGPVNY